MSTKKGRDQVIIFFNSIEDRRFSDASRALGTIKQRKFGDPDFKEGYINALEGILLSARTGDERDFYNKGSFDSKSIKQYRKEFRDFVKEQVHSSFDIGYFLAWSDMLQFRISKKKN
jgi:hypothetical protein